MRRLKDLLLLSLVVALVAAACSGGDSADTTAAPAGTDAAATTVAQTAGGTLATVISRGTLNCGIGGAAVGFSETQPDGTITGIDADYCRVIAAAVLGDANAVTFTETTAAERFEVLKSGAIDVLVRNTTWTQSRDTGDIGLDFGPTTFFDGQQVMGKAEFGFTEDSTLADVDGAVLCTNAGTTTEKNITEGAAVAGATIELKTVEAFPEAMEGFKAGDCDLVTTDGSGLYGNRAQAIANGEIAEGEWVIFPRAPISKEPLGPVYRQGDSQWADVVNWAVYATFIADEKGVTSANVDDFVAMGEDIDPELGRLLGSVDDQLQIGMGLPGDAFYQVIKQVGNYGEIFDVNLNPVKIFRAGTFNAQWTDGGLIYAPPAR